ncbi:OB-fold protein [Tamlana flava]|uniref:OB-fold protein n=1 Tax=Tamlana flava TaxID=3158572 RepID=UPI00351BC190
MKKWLILVVFIIAGISIYAYLNKNHRDIASEASSFNLSSEKLIAEFSINPIDSEQKYLNKTIEVSGLMTNLNPDNLTLNDKVFCQFSNEIRQTPSNNSQIIIKGRFIGYDDLLEEIKLDQCTIINNL